MKLITVLSALVASRTINARYVEQHETDQVVLGAAGDAPERFLVETSPGETRWITEEDKWEMRRNGQNFMDITATPDLGSLRASTSTHRKKSQFPKKAHQQGAVVPLLKHLSKANLQSTLERFTAFYTRYYKSEYGRQSSAWLLERVSKMIGSTAGAAEHGVSARHFPHPWGQHSVIVSIPGRSNATVVIGAHQDSINMYLPSVFAAPGADDDGSGSMTILEALRVLLTSEDVVTGRANNTIEFHWYSAEEGGLLGSQAVFAQYEAEGRDVRAMLQQDMTGYVGTQRDAAQKEAFGIITDFVDAGLTDYVKVIIDEYCDIGYALTKCGYACSDHASASKAGYPSAFVIESDFALSNQHIHTTDDVVDYLSFDHMLQHAKLTLGLVYELAFAEL